ncbi:ATP-grasp domain-containing protein [uncultured Winogradskyella sp.]|uniref:ATP-grasp domain-containing protein n=1 Tax=uncultured Winogradskyella sp. TaxID=395353 RepID=UPI00262D2240|nr:ATP-grasp domain-containing protein [uncultured Winogradskyella sp.]
MNILITSAGRRVSLVRAFQKELKKIYPESKVYASDSHPELSAACQVADHYFEVPRLDDELYLEEFVGLCQSNNIKLIIPTIDTELLQLSENKARLEKAGMLVVISSIDFIKKCRNKRQIHQFFEDKGIQTAEEYEKDNYSLPMFIKPYDGSRSVDTHVINTKSDLTDYHFENDKLMFLEYLNHDDFTEFTCDLYYSKDSQLKCAVPRKRLEVRDGEVYKALTENNALVEYIKEHLKTIGGVRGCVTAQFFMHNDDDYQIYAIEINPRFGGGYPLSYLAGANYPKWIIEEYFLNIVIDDKFDSWESDLLMIRYDDEILVRGYKG